MDVMPIPLSLYRSSMAKTRTSPLSDTPVETDHSVAEDSVATAEKTATKTQSESKSTDLTAKAEIPAYALNLLKTFRRYPELYIDTSGGVYTADSAAVIRGGAVLYKNPYHES